MRTESLHSPTILGEKLAHTRFEKAHRIVLAGFEGGHFKDLTRRQKEVLTILYLGDPPEESSTTDSAVIRYKQCGELLGMTRQAVGQSHNSAVRRLERVKNGLPPVQENNKVKNNHAHRLKMSPEERGYILEHSDLPAMVISKAIGHSEEVIGRWFDELGIPRKSRGHPRKQA